MSLQIRRGTDDERSGITFAPGEIIWTVDDKKLYVGDGVTAGGVNIASTLAGTNLAFNAVTGRLGVSGLTSDNITEGANNKFFTAERAQDAIGSAIAAGIQNGITVTYNDNGDSPATLDFTVTAGGGAGLTAVIDDPGPFLGGNLNINNNDIIGTGNINTIGNITAYGELTVNGLGGDLSLNSHGITGTGNIQIVGTFLATEGLGGQLDLNTYTIGGTGNIDITGNITATGTVIGGVQLSDDLQLNSYDVRGNGNINIVGDITSSGTVSALSVTGGLSGTLSDDLDLNLNQINGYGSIDITGSINVTGTMDVSGVATLGSIELTSSPDTAGINIQSNAGGNTNVNLFNIDTHHDDATAIGAFFGRSRGSVSSRATLTNGDEIFHVFFTGTTSDLSTGGAVQLTASVDGPISAGVLPGKFVISTSSLAGMLTPALSIDSSQRSTFAGQARFPDGTTTAPSIAFTTDGGVDTGFSHPGDGVIVVSSNTVEVARFDGGGIRSSGFIKVAQVSGTLPSPAEAGMIVLDGSTFKGYNGSTWVTLG